MKEETSEVYRAYADLVKSFRAFMENLSKFVLELVKRIKPFWEDLLGLLYKLPGYKRKLKAKQLAYHESISAGKSNNWRKVHGMHLARSNC